jgi:hypothetical protein
MNARQRISIILVAILALVLAACSGSRTAIPAENFTVTPVENSTTTPVENFTIFPVVGAGVIGWEADKDGVIAYSDGSFYIRDGRNQHCQFWIYNDPVSFQWYNCDGYLPALVTEFNRDGATVTITNFGDQVTLNDHAYVAIYSRVSITNPGRGSISLDPSPSAGLIALTNNPLIVPAGQTVNHDFVAAADCFGNTYAWPSDAELSEAGSWDEHYAHMKNYWNSRLSGIVDITRLPDPRLINAYKAGFIYTQIIQDGNDLHVGENGYDSVFDHDSVGILTSLFSLGDFAYAKPLHSSLQAHTQFEDARYKNSWVWALYLLKTGDTAFVQDNFAAIQATTHQFEADRTGSGGILGITNDIDANGYWTVDDESALFGLTTYRYLAHRLGYTEETAWAQSLYDSLMASANAKLQQTMDSNGIGYLPCDLTQPNTTNRCKDPIDANWASMLLFGRWSWDGYLWGAEQGGPLLDNFDATYGFDRLKGSLPDHTYGGDPGYSTGYNAGYGRGGLRGKHYRSEAILDYQFMLDKTQSSPFGWWENIQAPQSMAWEGIHPVGGTGACPHMWGQSFATAGLLDSLIVEKSDGTILVGRGVPTAWVADGQVIELSNYPISGNKRMGIRIDGLPRNQVRLTLTGDTPARNVIFTLPIFIDNIHSATSGTLDNTAGEVTLEPGMITVTA